ncbi:MAG TPA: tetratricopeptide repeat protein, partial [Syntrophales bacterium]|nr:tetratricopeptide repeat protein [Syntrophales bacterium]
AAFYPYLKEYSPFQLAGSALLLLITSCIVIYLARNYRYALVGWLWFLGTLVPVIGLIQAGPQAMADRYAYIPMIGLFIMIAWGVPDFLKKLPQRKIIFSVFSGAVLSALIICTLHQVRYWQNSVILFEHALRVTEENLPAHYYLGVALTHEGKPDEAIKQFEYVIMENPESADAYSYMGITLARQGKIDEAMAYFRASLQRKQHDEITHNNLGAVLIYKGRFDEAIGHIQEALNIRPDYEPANCNMGIALAGKGKTEQAIYYFEKALQLDKNDSVTHNYLGIALAKTGRLDEAVLHFHEALKINPHYEDAINNLRSVQNRL